MFNRPKDYQYMVLTKNPFVKFDKLFCKRILSFCVTVQTLTKKISIFTSAVTNLKHINPPFVRCLEGLIWQTMWTSCIICCQGNDHSHSGRRHSSKAPKKRQHYLRRNIVGFAKLSSYVTNFTFKIINIVSFNENEQAALTGCRVDGWGHYWAQ